MRRTALVLIPLALAACGSSARPAAGPKVTLKLTAPEDAKPIRAESIRIEGTVSPAGASVDVNGEAAEVDGSDFVAEVQLEPGPNLIDVTASAPGRRPDADAVRVMRDMRVEVPQLVGETADDATGALKDLGLEPSEERTGGFLDRLIPGDLLVCDTEPASGELVDPGTTVTVFVARSC